jgi:hypothetical protein
LKDIIMANPGISMSEAVIRLNAYNSAVARNEQPPPLGGSILASTLTSTSSMPAGVSLGVIGIGEGGMGTKSHREM